MSSPRTRKPVAMARTDDDSWDITEGVGPDRAGCGVVTRRRRRRRIAHCSPTLTRSCSSTPPWTAAGSCRRRTWSIESGRSRATPRHAPSGSTSSSSRQAPTASTRPSSSPRAWTPAAWRLPWVDDTRALRDRPAEGPRVQGRDARPHDATPSCPATSRCPSTCGRTGRKRCATRVSMPQVPTAWAAEGLLPYLPADRPGPAVRADRRTQRPGSRIGVESFGAGFFDPEYLASRREQLRQHA